MLKECTYGSHPRSDFVNDSRFLWVYFSIEDICAQKTDDGKRQAISNLPKDLPGIYLRALQKILSEGNQDIASAMFLWAAAAKRPLSIMEMREAIAVRVGQTELRESQMITDVESMVAWCNSLLVMDEEDCVVQFAHYSIKDFLQNLASILDGCQLETHIKTRLANFYISAERKDDTASQVCCTYLSYDAFDDRTVLATVPPKQKKFRENADLQPLNIARNTLMAKSSNVLVLRSWSLLDRYIRKGPKIKEVSANQSQEQLEPNQSDALVRSLREKHAFLAYASEFWLDHTVRLQKTSPIWHKFEALTTKGRNVAIKPWTDCKLTDEEDFNVNAPNTGTVNYACDNEHLGVLRLLMNGYSPLNFLQKVAQASLPFVEVYLTENPCLSKTGFYYLLGSAVESNRTDTVRRLLGPVVQWEEKFADFPPQTLLRYLIHTASLENRTEAEKENTMGSIACQGRVHYIMEQMKSWPEAFGMELETFLNLVDHPKEGPSACETCKSMFDLSTARKRTPNLSTWD